MTFTALALAGLSLVAAPAVDKAAPAAPAVDKAAPAAPAVDKAAPAAHERRYCVINEITGSILRYKTCKTYAEWMKQGVDPTARAS